MELVQNTLKIDEPQPSRNTELNFANTIKTNALNVVSSLNGVPIKDYQTVNKDLVMPKAHFNHVAAKVIHVSKDTTGGARLNGLDLHAFLKQHTWNSVSDTGNIHLKELVLTDALETDEIYGISSEYLLNFLNNVDELPELILNGKIHVDHVMITENVQVNKLNMQNFDEDIQLTVVWLNRPNYLSTNMIFAEPLKLQSDLVVLGDFNGVNLPDLVDDIVFHTNKSTTVIVAPKSFLNNVRVYDNTNSMALNGVPFSKIATKQAACVFNHSLQLNGQLFVNELNIAGHLNDYPVTQLNNFVRFDKNMNAFVMLQDAWFHKPVKFEDLAVYGDLNDIAALPKFFESLVYKDNVCMLKGNSTFTGRVSIANGASIRSLNNLDLKELLNNVAFINSLEPLVVKAPTSFNGTVVAVNGISIRDSLTTKNLCNCSLKEWLQNTLRVDKPQEVTEHLRFLPQSLDGNSLYASFLNDVDFLQIIPLHTEQDLASNLTFSKIYLDGQIDVKGLVNNVDLQQEYENTLLTHGDQFVRTPLTLQYSEVNGNLQVNTVIDSDKDLGDVATLHQNLEFESPLFFNNVTTRNTYTQELVSGINLEQWFNDSLWLSGRSPQSIVANWSVRSLSATSVQFIPNLEYDPLVRTPRDSKNNQLLLQSAAKILCNQQNRAQFLKYLTKSFVLDLKDMRNETINQSLLLEKNEKRYLLVNAGCHSFIFEWSAASLKYELFTVYESGLIDELLIVHTQNDSTFDFFTYGKTDQPSNCSFKGINSWRIGPANVSHLGTNNFGAFPKRLLRSKLNSSEYLTEASNLKPESLLKSYATLALKLHLFEFDQFIEKILVDLIHRLNLEVNVTQLSIPETDLYDEHLIQDFIDIMQELQKQQIFPKETFAKIDFEALRIPENPGEVLAIRTVQIIWPVIVEMEEIHDYLHENSSYKHPIYANITSSLGIMVRDVLLLANGDNNSTDHVEELVKVTKCIRVFQKDLKKAIEQLKALKKHKAIEDVPTNKTFLTIDDFDTSTKAAPSSTDFFKHEVLKQMPSNGIETLAIKVGNAPNFKTLFAVTVPKAFSVDDQDIGIKLYSDVVNGSLFQTINALNPRSLVTFRVSDETLLAYVENCCLVHVLTYRGVQGFVEILEFKTESKVIKLLSFTLPTTSYKKNYYLATVLQNRIVFYEFLLAGSKFEPQNLPACK